MPCTQFYRELGFGVPLVVLSKASPPEETPGLGWAHVDPLQTPPSLGCPRGCTWKEQPKTRRSQW